jgi:von Willebrand factor type A domain.
MLKFFSRAKTSAVSFMKDQSGNFGMVTAIILPVLIGAGGMSLDFSSALTVKWQMEAAADAGALAAASSLGEKKVSIEEARKLAQSYVSVQAASMGLSRDDYKTDIDIKEIKAGASSKQFEVTVDVAASMPTTLSQILGVDKIPIDARSTASSSTTDQSSMSMYLVLDRSGSMMASVTSSVKSTTKGCDYYYLNAQQTAMYVKANYKPCYYQRMEVLKTAVTNLMQSLEKADPDRKFIRTGAAAYSSDMFKPTDLAWGTTGVQNYVSDMFAEGGTSSTNAFAEAVSSLTKLAENTAHMTKNGIEPKKYLIFMTDGENNATKDNTNTLTQCTKAKNAGITVYTVGFMLASNTAKNLLHSCATSEKTYFDAQDGDKLTQAFADIARQTAGSDPLLIH